MNLYTINVHLVNVKYIIEIPSVYAKSCFNGRRTIYITSAERFRFRVTLQTETDGPILLSGERWRAFALANLNRDVRTLHFV
jgi:hypothetical protein